MTQAALADSSVDTGAALGAADHRLAIAGSVLASQITLGPSRLLDDETVARVRALAADLAAQLASPDHALTDYALTDQVRDMLVANRAILLHLHAISIETRLIAVLAADRAIDSVLPPLIQRRLDAVLVGDDAAIAATALLAAQARLGQSMRRMQLPLNELPGDLQHLARAVADAARAEHGMDATRAAPCDDTHGRLVLLRRVLAVLGDDAVLALRIDAAGVPLWLSALALASGYPREVVALACAEDDPLRLALLLRAAGLSVADAATQLLAIRADADPGLPALANDAHHADRLLGAPA